MVARLLDCVQVLIGGILKTAPCFSLKLESFSTPFVLPSLLTVGLTCCHCCQWIYAMKQSNFERSMKPVCVVSVPRSDKISWTASTHSLESNTEANLAAGPTPRSPTDGCCSLSEPSDPCCVQAQRGTVGTAGGGRRIAGSDLLPCTTWQLLIGLSWEF